MSGSVNPVWDSVVEFPVKDFTKVIFWYANVMQVIHSSLNNRKETIILSYFIILPSLKVSYVKPGKKCGISISHCVGHDCQGVTLYEYGVNI